MASAGDIAWSSCSNYVILLTSAGSIQAFNQYCNLVAAFQANDWIPRNSFSKCVKVYPFQQISDWAETAEGAMSVQIHVLFECVDIATLLITAKYQKRGNNYEYFDQALSLLNFGALHDISHNYLTSIGYDKPEKWLTENSIWLPISCILILVCKPKIGKSAGLLGSWTPFQTTNKSSMQKLSIFCLKFDVIAAGKKKFNSEVPFWTLLETSSSFVECISVLPAYPLPSENAVTSFESLSFWNNVSTSTGICDQGVRKMIHDQTEQYVLLCFF